jgi:hypothetical protein
VQLRERRSARTDVDRVPRWGPRRRGAGALALRRRSGSHVGGPAPSGPAHLGALRLLTAASPRATEPGWPRVT